MYKYSLDLKINQCRSWPCASEFSDNSDITTTSSTILTTTNYTNASQSSGDNKIKVSLVNAVFFYY